MELSGLKKIRTTIHSKSKKRIGRGYGSGVGGHTSTRGSNQRI
jgi:ribosomal protein L15